MNFKTNEASAQLLLALGFKETTEKVFSEFYKKIQEEGYDPHGMKREFVFNRRDYLTFNYISIQGWGRFSFFRGVQPDADKVRLLLLLIKLYPKNRRETIYTLKDRINRMRFNKKYIPFRPFSQKIWDRYLVADRETQNLLVKHGFDTEAMCFESKQTE